MILKALYDYYDRMMAKGEDLAPDGKEWKEIPYLIVIDEEGGFVRLEDTRGKDKHGRKFLVKKEPGRTIAITAYTFWDHKGYVLRMPKKSDGKKSEEALAKMAENQNVAFKEKVIAEAERFPNNKAFQAVKLFYERFDDNLPLIQTDPLYESLEKKDGANIAFQLRGEVGLVAEEPDVFTTGESQNPEDASRDGSICLITGNRTTSPIRLSTRIKIAGGKSSSSMVAFQRSSGYDSYYKEQCANAPISKEADFKYATALNYLLGSDSKNKLYIGGQTYIFWSKKQNQFEQDFSMFFTKPKDDPNRYTQLVRNLYGGVFSGTVNTDEDNIFYLVGLVPNAGRIFMSLYLEETTAYFAKNIRQHYEDIEIERIDDTPPGINSLLGSLVFEYKLENLPPLLFAATVRSVMKGEPYPANIQSLCHIRIKAEADVTPNRAALLKAYLNRKERINHPNSNNFIIMSLDSSNSNQGYLCGRLFAVIEKCQKDALGQVNATIKDKFLKAAAGTPAAVFGKLLAMGEVYLSKLQKEKPGYAINDEKLLSSIIENIEPDGFPAHLSLDDQSRFFIGYYHQQRAFYKAQEKTEPETTQNKKEE